MRKRQYISRNSSSRRLYSHFLYPSSIHYSIALSTMVSLPTQRQPITTRVSRPLKNMAGSIENNCFRVTHPIIPRSDHPRTVPQYIQQQSNAPSKAPPHHYPFDNLPIPR